MAGIKQINRIYINDFCEDLNYRSVILYIGEIDANKLIKALEKNDVNKLWRLEYALNTDDPAKRNFIYIENCDLQNLDWPLHEYMEEGYDVHVLYEDNGQYYIKIKID